MPRKVVEGRVRLFESEFLERLSRVHPLVPIAIWGPLALGLAVLGWWMGVSAGATVALFAIGMFGWSLAEYVLHRWIFHWVPKNEKVREIYYPVHELHHEVQEWDRLVTPPLMSVPFALAFLVLFYLLLGTPTLFPFFGGFLVGYLCYDYVHYYTHFVEPRNRIGKGLRKRHLQHHFAHPDRWYGVSTPLWDYVFRTHVPR